MMVASGVVGRENRAEVSLKSYVLISLFSILSSLRLAELENQTEKIGPSQ